MNLSFPTLPVQPGLTARYSVFLYTSIHPAIFWYCWQYKYLGVGAWCTPTTSTELSALIGCRRWEIGDLGWGRRTRHLDLFLHVPLFLWGGNHAASRRPAGVYIYTHRAIKGVRAGTLSSLRHSQFKWKHGTSGRQGKIGIQETKSWFRRLVSERRPNGNFSSR